MLAIPAVLTAARSVVPAKFNAGGNKAVKYGTTRNQIYGMKIVTPTGDIVDVGAHRRSARPGISLEQLICGLKVPRAW